MDPGLRRGDEISGNSADSTLADRFVSLPGKTQSWFFVWNAIGLIAYFLTRGARRKAD